MASRYIKFKKNPNTFLRLFGITPPQLEKIVEKLTPIWEKKVLNRYKRPGRDFKLSLEDMILMLLLYYRSYTTQIFVGCLFNIHESRVCRLIKLLEPILAEIMKIDKNRTLSEKEIGILIDATEQGIERPKKGQKPYYSGKKKKHTLKTEIRTSLKGEILHVSKTRPGSVHDFTLHKEEPPLPKDTTSFVDSAYQGKEKTHPNTEVPFKKSKNKPLDEEDKAYNTALSRIRVKIENVFAQIKVFKIMAERYRNKRKRYNLKFKIIAGIVNMKNGF